MQRKTITAHMVVRNEEYWLWYAIKAVIDLVDYIIIFDTGSTDATVTIIEYFLNQQEYRDKIYFCKKGNVTRSEFVLLRNEQVQLTKTDYFINVDGDEIWYEESLKKLMSALNIEQPDIVLVPFICCAGDVYHYKDPKKETYCHELQDGRKIQGAISARVFSNKIPGIHCGDNNLMWDGYFDVENKSIRPNRFKTYVLDEPYLHMSYLQRSNSIMLDSTVKWPSNRFHKLIYSSRYDYTFEKQFEYPNSFYAIPPSGIKTPWEHKMGFVRYCLQVMKMFKINILNLVKKLKEVRYEKI